jgi:acetyltransferase
MIPIYPSHLARHVLWRGERLLIRPVRADDAPGFVEGAKRCSSEDLRFRFLTSFQHLSEKLLAQLTQIDYEQHMAFVVEGLKGDIMAVTRLVRDGYKKSAEYAIIVRTDLQKQGLGTLAQKLLLDYASSLGIKEVWGLMDTENRRALNLATKLGFSRAFQFGLPFVRVVKALA